MPARVPAIDILRGAAILWVIIFHLSVDVSGFDALDGYYSDVTDAAGALDLFGAAAALWRLLVRLGYQGVPLFMMASGFVMTYNAIHGRRRIASFGYLGKRLKALLIPYWLAFSLTLGAIALLAVVRTAHDGSTFAYRFTDTTSVGESPYAIDLGTSLAGLSVIARGFRAQWLLAPSPSLWFVPIFVQFYLVFPLLFRAQERLGPWPFLGSMLGLTLIAKTPIVLSDRGFGLLFNWWIDVSYLPFNLFTFGLGMTLAWLFVHDRATLQRYTSGVFDTALLIYVGLVVQTAGALAQGRSGFVGIFSAPMIILGLTIIVLPWIANASEEPLRRRLFAILAMLGTMSYSILIASDPLRFVIGTMHSLHAPGIAWAAFILLYAPVLLGLAWLVELASRALVRERAAARL